MGYSRCSFKGSGSDTLNVRKPERNLFLLAFTGEKKRKRGNEAKLSSSTRHFEQNRLAPPSSRVSLPHSLPFGENRAKAAACCGCCWQWLFYRMHMPLVFGTGTRRGTRTGPHGPGLSQLTAVRIPYSTWPLISTYASHSMQVLNCLVTMQLKQCCSQGESATGMATLTMHGHSAFLLSMAKSRFGHSSGLWM